MKKDIFELSIPSKPDYISVVRLTSSSIASKIGLNIDEIEDIKVSLSEACINALSSTDKINIKFEINDNRFIITVKNVSLPSDNKKNLYNESELGILIIQSLMDEVNFSKEGVEMIKYIEDGKR
ncbi:ATP-binding protein [Schnuerera sp. xch1]|uniref:ATP-binding protein n=1 Tax=Schnuerera sp. xch1 TaxID=2874283 RepID=UPI001CBF40D0|nr:ATP-binding protein [Schnuerera sp. xch1]MBZ2175708.1 ATP-binding protein [Schnuerera sp. xch1]